ncbi:hypothetical protein AA14337_3135 [Acetobacter malorum DSM 14337]|uniref:Uncharacterized protein n=1 Tax=Acetobacter malorum DSM 14337 TaxID=1307910 RepID=A0ABQ0PZU2_9PROT|nr:hypothetical protein AD930_11310 [Acetobacter malorum]GBQ85675.1 hypothetical protein AA14337_3135 [Acetobacter malorum DSM 14337]
MDNLSSSSHSVAQLDDSDDSANHLTREVFLDLGKEVAHRIKMDFPEAVDACSSTFLLSVRNSLFNELISTLKQAGEGVDSVY